MKNPLLIVLSSLVSCSAQKPATVDKEPPSYISEAPLPEGWPKPGPYDRVSEKNYPTYRAVFTTQKGQAFAFWKLFGHIKKSGIPMTAPVEMGMEGKDAGLERSTMAFLYQNEKVGIVGPAGEKLDVRDVPAEKTLSYTWQGVDSDANIATAKVALEQELASRKLAPKSFRLLGYNGPGTPREKRTWELQAVIP